MNPFMIVPATISNQNHCIGKPLECYLSIPETRGGILRWSQSLTP